MEETKRLWTQQTQTLHPQGQEASTVYAGEIGATQATCAEVYEQMSLSSQGPIDQAQQMRQAFETGMRRAQSNLDNVNRESIFGSSKDKQSMQHYEQRLQLRAEPFEALHHASSMYEPQRSEVVGKLRRMRQRKAELQSPSDRLYAHVLSATERHQQLEAAGAIDHSTLRSKLRCGSQSYGMENTSNDELKRRLSKELSELEEYAIAHHDNAEVSIEKHGCLVGRAASRSGRHFAIKASTEFWTVQMRESGCGCRRRS